MAIRTSEISAVSPEEPKPGPSEILVVGDGSTDPDWVAMDLFSQAEHDELAPEARAAATIVARSPLVSRL